MVRQEQLPLQPFAREILEVPVAKEMSESFLAYSLSVITARAIPDIRDGLKPVQRRILFSMLGMGLRPTNPHRKCARVVGDTMGKYHPHGDMAIYEALVRMGQNFARMVTLVDPHGNFGSLDDPPAAARYTECRLTDAAMEMVREIEEDTVDFRPTYDGESSEPICLPGLLPNLLVNGTSGIAVGMATNMPTHNLREVYAAIELVMKKRRPKPTIKELLSLLPGPDFPSGGIIINDDLQEAYTTGRGSFRIRAKVEFEKITRSRQGIVVTELPYMVGPEKVVKRINELVVADKLEGVTDAKNLSDRKSGLRLLITLKPNVNPQAVLGELFRQTPLEDSFGINNVVLVNGVPETLGIYDLCKHYVDHRLNVVIRRTQFRLERAQERLHIVMGLIVALENIDRVVTIIRGSADVEEAKSSLRKELKLSEIQATHILDMQLRRLTALEMQKIIDERDELSGQINEYKKLLGSEQRQRATVLNELKETVDVYGTDRKTEIISVSDIPVYDDVPLVNEQEVPDEACLVTLSTSGRIGRTSIEDGNRSTPGQHDVLVSSTLTSTHSPVFAITSEGRALNIRAVEIGEVKGRSRGSSSAQIFATGKGEQILTVISPNEENLVLVTSNGVAKRITPSELAETPNGKQVIKLKPNDKLAAAFCCPNGVDVIVVASDAQTLRTPVDNISIQGRNAAGVLGMKLRDGVKVIGAGAALGDGAVITVTDIGTAKATPFEEITTKGRGGTGIRITKFTKEKSLVLAKVVGPDVVLAIMATDEDPKKADPVPVDLPLEPTKRDLVSVKTERKILDIGPPRW
ncbi:MAG: DNA topoisomerase 4 subunit A [Acidimicrobiales bacterium]|nr:DNA topoisomerase 4 subunit A [Acidimicrobiales bacterium]